MTSRCAPAMQVGGGAVWHRFDLGIGFLRNDDVTVGEKTGGPTSSSSNDLKVESDSFYALLGYRIPMLGGVSLIPEVGAIRSSVKPQESFTTIFSSGGRTSKETTKLPTNSEDNTDVMYGAGAARQATRNLAILIEFWRAKFGGQSGTTNSALVGARWNICGG